MTQHNHSLCCEHANMAYCKHCRVPYCKDCGYEWKSYNYWYNGYPWTYTLGNGLVFGKGDTAGQVYTSGNANAQSVTGHTVEVKTCSGKHEA